MVVAKGMTAQPKACGGRRVRLGMSDKVFDVTVGIFAIIVMIMIVYPLYFIVIASFSEPAAVATGQVWLRPYGFTLDGYRALLVNESIWIGYRNTILYATVGTFISLAVNVPAGYVLSRRDLYLRKLLTFYFLVTMFFSGGLIPIFLTVLNFGLFDTFLVMVLPFSVSVFSIIVARTFFRSSIPAELKEAAEMDGCGNLRFFFVIVLPLSKAIIAVLALWSIVGHWNSFFTALIYLQNRALFPLQLVLRNILITGQLQGALGTGEAAQIALREANLIRYTAIIISTLPMMCVYPFLQKYFNQGVMIGAVKG